MEGDPFMAYRASEIAAGCICLANDTLGDEPWVSVSQVENPQLLDFAVPLSPILHVAGVQFARDSSQSNCVSVGVYGGEDGLRTE